MITFIILTRNNPKYLQDCLSNLMLQTQKGWNAIVIDTSDTDNQFKNRATCHQYQK